MKDIDPASWKRLRALFDQALELEGGARRQFAATLDGADADLRDSLLALIAQYESLDQASMASAMDLAAPALAHWAEEEGALDESRVGSDIGPYRLVRLLGAGGMGTVYLAERVADGFTHQVALKLMRHALFSASAKERFDRERQILAALNYPGVALLFDGGRTPEGQAYYTMEYVDGEPIGEFCRKRNLPVRARVELLLQVATVLAYAHQNLIVHRDIKSSNVLVTSDGRAKLVDFGLAKLLDIRGAPSMTAESGPMTPAYAAPEQFYNSTITTSTDIYQLGVLCFLTLTGRLPYRADPNDGLSWARAVTEQEPMTLAQAAEEQTGDARTPRRQLTRDLDAVVRKAIAKEPHQRYRSMDAMIADLEAFLDSRPIRARRAGPLYFVWRFVRRWRYAVVPALCLFLVWGVTGLIANRSILYWVSRSDASYFEAQRSNAVASFIGEVFQAPDLGNRAARDGLTLDQLLDRSEKRMQSRVASIAPERRARLEAIAGEAYLILGDLPRARAAFETTASIPRGSGSTDAYHFGHSLRMLARTLYLQGDAAAALSALAEAEAALRTTSGSPVAHELVEVRDDRGSVYASLGHVAEARTEFEQALVSARAAQLGQVRIAGIEEDLGNVLRGWRRNEAVDVLNEALRAYDAWLGADDPATTKAMENLAAALIDVGNARDAEPLIAKAMPRNAVLHGLRSADYAASLMVNGAVLASRADFDHASDQIAQARDIYRASEGPQSLSGAVASRHLARIDLDRGEAAAAAGEIADALAILDAGDRYDARELALALDLAVETQLALDRYADAAAGAERAAPLFRSGFPADHPALVQSLLHLGLARYAVGDTIGARAAWDEALARSASAYGAGSPETAKVRDTIAHPQTAIHARPSEQTAGAAS